MAEQVTEKMADMNVSGGGGEFVCVVTHRAVEALVDDDGRRSCIVQETCFRFLFSSFTALLPLHRQEEGWRRQSLQGTSPRLDT